MQAKRLIAELMPDGLRAAAREMRQVEASRLVPVIHHSAHHDMEGCNPDVAGLARPGFQVTPAADPPVPNLPGRWGCLREPAVPLFGETHGTVQFKAFC